MPRRSNEYSIKRFIVIVRAVLLRLSVLLFCGMLLILMVLSITRPESVAVVRTYFMDVVSPVMRMVNAPQEWVENIGKRFDETIFIYDENEKLRKESTKVPQLEQEMRDIFLENQRLKRLLGYVSDLRYEYVTARVVGNVGQPYRRQAMVAAGQISGLQSGLVAQNEQGLVGRLLEVGLYSSRLLLITDKDSRVPVMTEQSRERAIAAGDQSDSLRLLYLPENTSIQVGERVLSSGDGGVFPPDIPVGVVEQVGGGVVTVRPYVDWWRLEYVQVVRPKQTDVDPMAGNAAQPLKALDLKASEEVTAAIKKPEPAKPTSPKPAPKKKPEPAAVNAPEPAPEPAPAAAPAAPAEAE